MRSVADPAMTKDAAFPGERRAAVMVETGDGVRYSSELCQAPGEPDDPGWADIVAAKFARYAGGQPDDCSLRRLLG